MNKNVSLKRKPRIAAALLATLTLGAAGINFTSPAAAAPVPVSCSGENQYGKHGYLCDLYDGFLKRWPDEAGHSYWVGILGDTQSSRLRAVQALAYSAERRGQLVRDVYGELLARTPSAGETSSWSGYLATGGVELFEASVMGSPEFYADAGSMDEGIRWVYLYTVERAATPAEVLFWHTWISDGNSRAEFARLMIRGDEGRETKVQKLYADHLGRPADPAGLAYWKNRLAAGASWLQVQNSLFASNERFSFFHT